MASGSGQWAAVNWRDVCPHCNGRCTAWPKGKECNNSSLSGAEQELLGIKLKIAVCKEAFHKLEGKLSWNGEHSDEVEAFVDLMQDLDS